jgi:hypothetical protein
MLDFGLTLTLIFLAIGRWPNGAKANNKTNLKGTIHE